MKIRSMLLVTLLLSYIWASEGVAEDLTKVIENSSFLFKVPIEMQEVEVQGIDSFVKRYESDTIMLSFDYGWYSNNFSDWPENTTFEEVEIGGKLARIGTVKYQFRDGFPYATQVHFKLDDDVKLSMFAACKTVVDVAIAHGVFGTIVFKDKSPGNR